MMKQMHRAVKGLAQGHTAGKRWGHFKPRPSGCRVHMLSWTSLIIQTQGSSSDAPSPRPPLPPSSLLCPALEKQALQFPSCLAPSSLHWLCPSTSSHAPDNTQDQPLPTGCHASYTHQLHALRCCSLHEGIPHPLHSEPPQLCRPFLSYGELLPV